jgi:hypothetical protein
MRVRTRRARASESESEDQEVESQDHRELSNRQLKNFTTGLLKRVDVMKKKVTKGRKDKQALKKKYKKTKAVFVRRIKGLKAANKKFTSQLRTVKTKCDNAVVQAKARTAKKESDFAKKEWKLKDNVREETVKAERKESDFAKKEWKWKDNVCEETAKAERWKQDAVQTKAFCKTQLQAKDEAIKKLKQEAQAAQAKGKYYDDFVKKSISDRMDLRKHKDRVDLR